MLTIKQKKCIEFMVEGTFSQKEIAARINVTEKTICEWKKNDEFMKEYNSLLRINIQSLAAKAYKKQIELLNAKNEMVKYMVSKDILDRAGFKPPDKLDVTGNNMVVIVDDCDQ